MSDLVRPEGREARHGCKTRVSWVLDLAIDTWCQRCTAPLQAYGGRPSAVHEYWGHAGHMYGSFVPWVPGSNGHDVVRVQPVCNNLHGRTATAGCLPARAHVQPGAAACMLRFVHSTQQELTPSPDPVGLFLNAYLRMLCVLQGIREFGTVG